MLPGLIFPHSGVDPEQVIDEGLLQPLRVCVV